MFRSIWMNLTACEELFSIDVIHALAMSTPPFAALDVGMNLLFAPLRPPRTSAVAPA
jgi:hypothetical protein